MAYRQPPDIADITVKHGVDKARVPLANVIVLGFLAGAFVALGFLLYIRVIGGLPEQIWGSYANFLGGTVFSVGLVFVLVAGGELLTGNMMAVAMARFAGKITTGLLIKNWVLLIIMNFIGSIFVAYFFGHFLELTESGPFLNKTIHVAAGKLEDTFWQAFVSGIGANWLVCLAVWLSYASEDVVSKIVAIWFPIMAFVAIGFQHVVANMFIIPAAIFAGHFTWGDYLFNFFPVLFGNAVGGAIFVGGMYFFAYLHNPPTKA